MQKQIEEVMGLVRGVIAKSAAIPVLTATGRDAAAKLTSDRIEEEYAAIESKLRELLPVWQPIESAPAQWREMFVVRAFKIDPTGRCESGSYTSDAYCVWRGDDGQFMRWPHTWKPTHWMPLPKAPE